MCQGHANNVEKDNDRNHGRQRPRVWRTPSLDGNHAYADVQKEGKHLGDDPVLPGADPDCQRHATDQQNGVDNVRQDFH